MKKLRNVLIPLLLVWLLCLSGCGGIDLIDPFGIHGEDAFDPFNTNTLKEPDFIDFTVSRLLYEELPEKEKQAYRRIYNAVFDNPARIVIPKLTEEELSEVFLALKYDNPYILSLQNTYTYYYTNSKFYFLPEYNADKDECTRMTRELIEAAKTVCDGLPVGTDEYTRELYLHDRLISLVSYSDGKNSDTAYGALVDGKAACGGYALASKLLFDIAGIRSTAVCGEAAGTSGRYVPHMWLAVSINKNWYFIDPAWDDPIGSADETSVRHTYFNVNEEQLSLTHRGYVLPAAIRCVSDTAEYYTASGLLCSADDWREIIEKKLGEDTRLPAHFEFRFSSDGVFRDACAELFEEGGIGELLQRFYSDPPRELSVSHSFDEDRAVIHLYVRDTEKE